MTIFDVDSAIEELAFFLRNSDIFTIAQRGVTTATDTGTFASDSTHLISNASIKNIRSIVVAAVTLTFGTDYTYDTNFDDTTKKTKITFTSAQTGDFTITYDTGSDKIFTDWPKNTLSLSQFPRIAVFEIADNSEILGFGNQKIASQTAFLFSIVAFHEKTRSVREISRTIRNAIVNNQNGFFYLKIVTPVSSGSVQVADNTRDEIFMKNQDFISSNNIERP